MSAQLVSLNPRRYPIQWRETWVQAEDINWFERRHGPCPGQLWERIAEGKKR